MKDSESVYITEEKECLAIVLAIKKFQKYLHVYGQEFVLKTDHSPLVYLNKSKVTNPRLMRWALSLQPYRFRIEAIKGKDYVWADFLVGCKCVYICMLSILNIQLLCVSYPSF